MMASSQWYLIVITVCNVLLCSYGNFVRTPPNDSDLHAILRDSYKLQCNYTGFDESGEFLEWFRDDSPVKLEKTGHYAVEVTDKSTQLTILIFVTADAAIQKWSVKTKKGGYEDRNACEFGPIKATPSPQGMETDRGELLTGGHESIRRVEDEPLVLKCLIKPEPDSSLPSRAIEWKYGTNENNLVPITAAEVDIDRDELKIARVKKIHRGYYQCNLNNISFAVLLRVKDRLAALWPFLGIVGIILALVIIILIFEKRQKSTRRALPTDEEDHDHANDPLVRSANKTADNENKKRTVKA